MSSLLSRLQFLVPAMRCAATGRAQRPNTAAAREEVLGFAVLLAEAVRAESARLPRPVQLPPPLRSLMLAALSEHAMARPSDLSSLIEEVESFCVALQNQARAARY